MRARVDRRHGRGPLARGLVLGAFFALLLAAAPALADGGEKGSVLVHVAGRGRAKVERAIERVLEGRGYEVLEARGKPGTLGDEAAERGAAVVVAAELRGGKRPVLVVTVRDTGGDRLGRARFRARNRGRLVRRVRRDLWDEIGRAVTRGVRAARPAVAEAEDEREEREELPADDDAAVARDDVVDTDTDETDAGLSASVSPGAPATGALALTVSGELLSRRYSYTDDLFDELRGYSVALRPGVGVGATWFPAAHLGSRGLLRRLGIAARYVYVPGFRTVTADGRRYDTKANAFRVGARWLQPVGGLRLAGIADYAGRRFTMARGDALRGPAVPDVLYRSLRLGVSAETSVASTWTAGGALAYRHVLDAGEVMESSEYFPRSTVRGVDAELWLARPIPGGFDLRAAAAFEQYGYALNPEPGDPKVAGGAADRYFTVSLGLVYQP